MNIWGAFDLLTHFPLCICLTLSCTVGAWGTYTETTEVKLGSVSKSDQCSIIIPFFHHRIYCGRMILIRGQIQTEVQGRSERAMFQLISVERSLQPWKASLNLTSHPMRISSAPHMKASPISTASTERWCKRRLLKTQGSGEMNREIVTARSECDNDTPCNLACLDYTEATEVPGACRKRCLKDVSNAHCLYTAPSRVVTMSSGQVSNSYSIQ